MKNIITIAALTLLISACSMQAPPYNPSMENIQTIKLTKINKVNVGIITSSKELNSISLRGSSMHSPIEKSYGTYLSKALEEELKLAKLWSGVSSSVITGKVLTNDVDISSFTTGASEISANFVVTRDAKVIYNDVISAKVEFESSFMGAIAIPNGQASYVNLVQKLIKTLFEDDKFIAALKS